MLSRWVLDGVVAGEITCAFRRWASPHARSGTRMRTQVGVVVVTEVTEVQPQDITEDQAAAAGYRSRSGLLSSLDKYGSGSVWRVGLRHVGEDPREVLRQRPELDAEERADLDRRLARMDASSRHGPWTRHLLRLIRDRPGVRAAELAESQNRPVARFKSDVWKLKELGLTESLRVGYRLSPRGEAYLAHCGSGAS
ncbi:hypothetical protein GIY23_10760 [Allosaccharopolyspora coralli]|uniref:ASCH domain-containing protein n=1 Tax=Allosaccharopolyspora coralli TaxID=2665642 RepID=A0A5Q3QCC2_9PSEU|nr:hypothetical protein GIY23_10760 [Allosaccharopolyspora coralli]